jgi:hypothetical protein
MNRTESCGEATVRLTSADERIEVRTCPRGPLLVRGADSVHDEDGEAHAVTRPVVAVCACGKTQRRPWCDGTHKAIPR